MAQKTSTSTRVERCVARGASTPRATTNPTHSDRAEGGQAMYNTMALLCVTPGGLAVTAVAKSTVSVVAL